MPPNSYTCKHLRSLQWPQSNKGILRSRKHANEKNIWTVAGRKMVEIMSLISSVLWHISRQRSIMKSGWVCITLGFVFSSLFESFDLNPRPERAKGEGDQGDQGRLTKQVSSSLTHFLAGAHPLFAPTSKDRSDLLEPPEKTSVTSIDIRLWKQHTYLDLLSGHNFSLRQESCLNTISGW